MSDATDQSVNPWGNTGAAGQISTGTANPWSGSADLLVGPTPQIAQQDIQSKALASNLVGTETIQLGGNGFGSVVLNNGDEVLLQTIFSTVNASRVIGSIEWAIFIDSVDIAHLFPGGSAIIEQSWTFMGPITSLFVVASSLLTHPPVVGGEQANGNMQVEYAYIANLTGSSHTVYFYNRTRYISNSGSPA